MTTNIVTFLKIKRIIQYKPKPNIMATKIKVKMVIMSHLSDAQEEVSMGYATKGILHNLNFVKYLVMHCGNDLEQEIDADYMYQMFVESQK